MDEKFSCGGRQLNEKPIYCTWTHRSSLPSSIKSKFQDLDEFIRSLIETAKTQLIIVSPYLSPAGISTLKNAIAIAANKGVWIRLLTFDLGSKDSLNFKAIKTLLSGDDGKIIAKRFRVLIGSNSGPEIFHSKLILCDGEKGYLGSANISYSGFEKNFEVGVELEKNKAEALHDLINYLEAQGMISDVSERFSESP
jgi:phosphatidylserine/phosphatidylglycerophosphate/cardiolipin synthase-like enzyme